MKLNTKEPWYFHGINSSAAEDGCPVIETACYPYSYAHSAANIRIVLKDKKVWPDDFETSRQMREPELASILKQLGLN